MTKDDGDQGFWVTVVFSLVFGAMFAGCFFLLWWLWQLLSE
jgi:hypothetical protein